MIEPVIIGSARLYLGDCLEVLPLQADVLITDPPYGIDYASGHSTEALWSGGDRIASDRDTAARDAAMALFDGPMLIFGSWKAPRPPGTRTVLVWDKGGALGMGALDIPWKPDHEEIYVIGKGFVGTRDSGSVLRHPPVQSMAKNGREHPTEKPLRLMRDLLRKTAGTVLDPFMGSGSTGVAAVQMGRPFVGVEINPAYFEIARRRIDQAHRQGHLFAAEAPEPDKQEELL